MIRTRSVPQRLNKIHPMLAAKAVELDCKCLFLVGRDDDIQIAGNVFRHAFRNADDAILGTPPFEIGKKRRRRVATVAGEPGLSKHVHPGLLSHGGVRSQATQLRMVAAS